MHRAFLSAHWKYLLMLNYEVEPELLTPYVPHGTELDVFEGRCFVSMVGFLFLDTRLLGVPIPFHRNFEEINLRFYVRREAAGELRRGVVFIKEVVPKHAIAFVARTLYHENYVRCSTRHEIRHRSDALNGPAHVEYAWQSHGRWHVLAAETFGEPLFMPAESEEVFITEHYWGYTKRRDGSSGEYRVEHPPWRIWRTRDSVLDCDLAAVYGAPFAEAMQGPPRSAFLAEGSEVTVRWGARM